MAELLVDVLSGKLSSDKVISWLTGPVSSADIPPDIPPDSPPDSPPDIPPPSLHPGVLCLFALEFIEFNNPVPQGSLPYDCTREAFTTHFLSWLHSHVTAESRAANTPGHEKTPFRKRTDRRKGYR